MIDQTLFGEYLSEVEELLDSLLTDLELLADPGHFTTFSGKPATQPLLADLINRVFVTVHSLKGLSGMMGLHEIQSLAHEYENVLEDLRIGRLGIGGQLASKLREAGEDLSILIVAAARGSAGPEDYLRLGKLLTELIDMPRVRRGATAGAELLELSGVERALLTQYEGHRIGESLRHGNRFFEIILHLPVSELDTRFMAVRSSLGAAGELIGTLPAATSSPDLVAFKLIFATPPDTDLAKLISPFADSVASLKPVGTRQVDVENTRVTKKAARPPRK
ncbi:MAG TPA: Hpt domain-containing protein, partial [Blastocatellia bacterium]|nr:Hpt domain-containing protein [Blastocatellia bacterium]